MHIGCYLPCKSLPVCPARWLMVSSRPEWAYCLDRLDVLWTLSWNYSRSSNLGLTGDRGHVSWEKHNAFRINLHKPRDQELELVCKDNGRYLSQVWRISPKMKSVFQLVRLLKKINQVGPLINWKIIKILCLKFNLQAMGHDGGFCVSAFRRIFWHRFYLLLLK